MANTIINGGASPYPKHVGPAPICSFSDGAQDAPLKSLKFSIEPQQSGSGDPSPSNIRPISGWSQVDAVAAGGNLIDATFSTVNASNIITNTFSLKAGTYTLSMKYNGTPTYGVYIRNGSTIQATSVTYWYNATTQTFTLDKDYDTLCISIYYGNGITPSEVSEVMIVQGSTASPYATPTLTPITISLGQTVYGGTVDALAGEGESQRAAVVIDGNSTVAGNATSGFYVAAHDMLRKIDYTTADIICDRLPTLARHVSVADNNCGISGYTSSSGFLGQNWIYFATGDPNITTVAQVKTWLASNPLTVVYRLTSPTTLSPTPVSVSSLLGQNNIWANTGETEVDYYPAAASVVAVLNRSSKVYTSIPLGKIRYDTYQTTPNQALDLDSYRAETGVLIRNVLSHTATKIEFNTPSMTNAQWEEVWNIIKAGFNNSTERKLKLKYYDQMSATYKTGWFYVPDVNFTIRNIDEANGIINYDEVRVAFIEY